MGIFFVTAKQHQSKLPVKYSENNLITLITVQKPIFCF